MDHRPDDSPIDIAGLWKDLQGLTRDVVEEMNRLEEFRQRTGGLDFQQGSLDTIVVKKQSVPSICLTLTRRAAVIDVHHKIVIKGPHAKEQETRESLSIEVDETRRLVFRNKEGESLTIEEVVFYILRPFYRPALLSS